MQIILPDTECVGMNTIRTLMCVLNEWAGCRKAAVMGDDDGVAHLFNIVKCNPSTTLNSKFIKCAECGTPERYGLIQHSHLFRWQFFHFDCRRRRHCCCRIESNWIDWPIVYYQIDTTSKWLKCPFCARNTYSIIISLLNESKCMRSQKNGVKMECWKTESFLDHLTILSALQNAI